MIPAFLSVFTAWWAFWFLAGDRRALALVSAFTSGMLAAAALVAVVAS